MHKLQYLHSATEFKQATINDAKFVENLNLKKENDKAEKWNSTLKLKAVAEFECSATERDFEEEKWILLWWF